MQIIWLCLLLWGFKDYVLFVDLKKRISNILFWFYFILFRFTSYIIFFFNEKKINIRITKKNLAWILGFLFLRKISPQMTTMSLKRASFEVVLLYFFITCGKYFLLQIASFKSNKIVLSNCQMQKENYVFIFKSIL